MKKRHRVNLVCALSITVAGCTTQIDHVVLSRKGIFCIETKNLNGELKGDVED